MVEMVKERVTPTIQAKNPPAAYVRRDKKIEVPIVSKKGGEEKGSPEDIENKFKDILNSDQDNDKITFTKEQFQKFIATLMKLLGNGRGGGRSQQPAQGQYPQPPRQGNSNNISLEGLLKLLVAIIFGKQDDQKPPTEPTPPEDGKPPVPGEGISVVGGGDDSDNITRLRPMVNKNLQAIA